MSADLQVGVALEHPAEDQVPHRPVGEPGELDQHDGPRHLEVAVVGDPAAAVDIDDDSELLAQLPQGLVDGVPQGCELDPGGTAGRRIPAKGQMVDRPADLGDARRRSG